MSEIQKYVKLDVKSIAFTSKPRTGKEIVFYKGGDKDMPTFDEEVYTELRKSGDIPQADRLRIRQAIRTLEGLRSVPTYIMKSLDTLAAGGVTGFDPSSLSQYNVPKEVIDQAIADKTTRQETIKKSDDDLVRSQEVALKKSCDGFVEKAAWIPVEKSELSNILYDVYSALGEDAGKKLETILQKSAEAITKGDPAPQKDKGVTAGAPPADFMVELKKSFDMTDAGRSPAARMGAALAMVKKSHRSLYDEYNASALDGKAKAVTPADLMPASTPKKEAV